ncbi:MAG: response regulator [Flavobacteriales bacterium]|nr:response regulator [Flavobacteriales bacterium]
MESIKERALIIEDDYMTAELIEDILADNEFQKISVAETGQRAIDLVKSNEFDLITLDNQLPNFFGSELIKILREINSTVDIVVISSINNEHLSMTLNEYNIKSYIHKGNLVEDLNQLLGKL